MLPGCDGPLVYGQAVVRNECGFVHFTDNTGSVAGTTCAAGIEGKLLSAWREKGNATDGADQRLAGSNMKRRLELMTIGTAVMGKPGVHETKTVEEFCPGAECASDARDRGPLVKRQGSRNITHILNQQGYHNRPWKSIQQYCQESGCGFVYSVTSGSVSFSPPIR